MQPSTPLSKKPATEKEVARQNLRINQVTGVIVGVFGAWMTGSFWPELPATMPLGWGGVVAWGAVIGAILGSLPQLAQFGRALTRRENGIFNAAVALTIPLIFILILAFVFRAF